MSRTEYIYSDKLSLELFREGKRPVDNGVGIEGLLFINTKPTGSTKLAIRPKTGQFTIGEQSNQNPSAGVDARTNYLLFCDNIHTDTEMNCQANSSITNRAELSGKSFMLEKAGTLSAGEFTVNALLQEIEQDPNLVVLYDHVAKPGYNKQQLISPMVIIGATSTFYIELDGVHINPKGENLIEAMLNYADNKHLLISANGGISLADIITRNNIDIENRDSVPHTLYIRYIGSDPEILQSAKITDPLIFTDSTNGHSVDPDGLGVMITFAGQPVAHMTVQPWFQYNTGGDCVTGNRYVIEVNGVKYRDTRTVHELSAPTASLSAVVELNPELALLLKCDSGGDYNRFENLSGIPLHIKIYLDEEAAYFQNDKTVDAGDNPTGIYKKLQYPYGSERDLVGIRSYITRNPSVIISVTNDGYSFVLGPKNGEVNE